MIAEAFPLRLWSWLAAPLRGNTTPDRPRPDSAEHSGCGRPPLQPASEAELQLHLRHLGWFS